MTTNDTTQRPKPHALVVEIKAAAEAAGITQAALAASTGQTVPRTGDVLRGYAPAHGGGYRPAQAQALVLCRLAQVTGITPERVRELGRDDVAELMEAAPTVPQADHVALLDELRDRLDNAG